MRRGGIKLAAAIMLASKAAPVESYLPSAASILRPIGQRNCPADKFVDFGKVQYYTTTKSGYCKPTPISRWNPSYLKRGGHRPENKYEVQGGIHTPKSAISQALDRAKQMAKDSGICKWAASWLNGKKVAPAVGPGVGEVADDCADVLSVSQSLLNDPEAIAEVLPTIPSMPARARSGVERWLMDTGSPFDIVEEANCTKQQIDNADQLASPHVLSTAGGITEVGSTVPYQVGPLKEEIDPILLPSSPPVLSLGRRVMELGYGFYWPPRRRPYLITPRGRKITLEVDDFVPYLVEGAPGRSMAAKFVKSLEARARPTSPLEGLPATAPKDVVDAMQPDSAEPVANKGIDLHDESTADNSKGPDDKVGPDWDLICQPCEEGDPYDINSLAHQATHRVFLKGCPECESGSMQRAPAKSGASLGEAPTEFGALTCDHFTQYRLDGRGADNEAVGFVIKDRATKMIDCIGQQNRDEASNYDALNRFVGKTDAKKIKVVHSDKAKEIIGAVKALGWNAEYCTPGRHTGNAIAERSVRRVLDGIRRLLKRSGMPYSMWPLAAKCFCFNFNTEVVNGESSWNNRHQKGHFSKLRLPFGCRVDFMQQKKYLDDQLKGLPKAIPGIFLGYVIQPGYKFDGQYLCADLNQIRNRVEGMRDGRPLDLKELITVQTTQELRPIMNEAGHFQYPLVPLDIHIPISLEPVGTFSGVDVPKDDDDEREANITREEGSVVEPRGPRLGPPRQWGGGVNDDGTPVRQYAGSKRPRCVTPDAWGCMTPDIQKKVTADYKKYGYPWPNDAQKAIVDGTPISTTATTKVPSAPPARVTSPPGARSGGRGAQERQRMVAARVG